MNWPFPRVNFDAVSEFYLLCAYISWIVLQHTEYFFTYSQLLVWRIDTTRQRIYKDCVYTANDTAIGGDQDRFIKTQASTRLSF